MLALLRNQAMRGQGRAAAAWVAAGPGRAVLAGALLTLAGLSAFTLYETAWLGLPIAREEPAVFDLYHLVRSAFTFLACGLLVAALVRARARPCGLDRDLSRPSSLLAGAAAFGAALAAAALFAVDPSAFHLHAQEDRPLEWASAGLLFLAGGLLALDALRRSRAGAGRSHLPFLLAAGLALALLVMAMEEISWGQRLFGFATPERLAEANWQGEFNFHNLQTDLSETVYFFGASIFLILLPLLRDLVPPALARQRLFDFVPRRSVALVGAPLALFNYGHWNLLPVQLGTMLALFVMLAFAAAARRRRDRVEAAAFGLAAVAVAAGEALFLVLGPAMTELPDATEYKELFIALGFAWYAFTVARRRSLG